MSAATDDEIDRVIGDVLEEVLAKYRKSKRKTLRRGFYSYEAAHHYFVQRSVYSRVWRKGCPIRDAIQKDLRLREIIATEALDELIPEGHVVIGEAPRSVAANMSAKPTYSAERPGGNRASPQSAATIQSTSEVSLPKAPFKIDTPRDSRRQVAMERHGGFDMSH